MIGSFGAASLLLVLGAIPLTWGIRSGVARRLIDVRAGLRVVGALLILETLIALMLTK